MSGVLITIYMYLIERWRWKRDIAILTCCSSQKPQIRKFPLLLHNMYMQYRYDIGMEYWVLSNCLDYLEGIDCMVLYDRGLDLTVQQWFKMVRDEIYVIFVH